MINLMQELGTNGTILLGNICLYLSDSEENDSISSYIEDFKGIIESVLKEKSTQDINIILLSIWQKLYTASDKNYIKLEQIQPIIFGSYEVPNAKYVNMFCSELYEFRKDFCNIDALAKAYAYISKLDTEMIKYYARRAVLTMIMNSGKFIDYKEILKDVIKSLEETPSSIIENAEVDDISDIFMSIIK